MVNVIVVSGNRTPAAFSGFQIAQVSDLHNAEFGHTAAGGAVHAVQLSGIRLMGVAGPTLWGRAGLFELRWRRMSN